MRFAYADPPHLGTSKFGAEHHYGTHHPGAVEYDGLGAHLILVDRLVDEFTDGWAMSTNTTSLAKILPHCPPETRVCAWVKGWCSWKPGVHPKYAWEPVLLCGGRKDTYAVRDWFQCNVTTNQKIPGAKPELFCRWVLQLLGYQEGDEIVDLFPGTGVMGRVAAQGVLVLRYAECEKGES